MERKDVTSSSLLYYLNDVKKRRDDVTMTSYYCVILRKLALKAQLEIDFHVLISSFLLLYFYSVLLITKETLLKGKEVPFHESLGEILRLCVLVLISLRMKHIMCCVYFCLYETLYYKFFFSSFLSFLILVNIYLCIYNIYKYLFLVTFSLLIPDNICQNLTINNNVTKCALF